MTKTKISLKTQVSPKAVGLIFGILVLLFVLGFYIFAWQEPSVSPPGGNVPSPLNVGSLAQTKTGDLTIKNLYLNPPGFTEGSIYKINGLIGNNDLILRGDAINSQPIYIEGSRVIINNDPGTGNVGIGTAWPNEALHIVGSGYATEDFRHRDFTTAIIPVTTLILVQLQELRV